MRHLNIYPQSWNEAKREIINTWGHVTEDELDSTLGDFDSIVGLLQDKYGESRDSMTIALNEVLQRFSSDSNLSSAPESESAKASGF